MGIEPYLVSSSIEAILAQRLIRLVCPKCKVPDKIDTELFEKEGFYDAPHPTSPQRGEEIVDIYKAGAGCEECRQTGYKGRTGIYELLVLDDDLRHLVLEKTSSGNIRQAALKKGMTTLRQDGFRKVKAGLTTIEEILRVTQEESL
jgi:type II secretory ATPase GspE/PulE/Tfp pilus assembly ATPase PilB-like protein